MKYNMSRVKKEEKSFKPFVVTIELETMEEYLHFHSNVAGKITGGAHKFIVDLYEMGRNKQEEATGKI